MTGLEVGGLWVKPDPEPAGREENQEEGQVHVEVWRQHKLEKVDKEALI